MQAVYWAQSKTEREAQQMVKEANEREQNLMVKIGQLTVENDWLKKKSAQVRARIQLGE